MRIRIKFCARNFILGLAVAVILGIAVFCFLFSDFITLGGIHYTDDPLTPEITEDELSAHIRFFAQDVLKGRRPMSMGSGYAREYIVDHFQRIGLKPWGNNETLEHSFKIGTNVIGVLDGRDGENQDKVIVISAHYDHVGNGRLGAADNASGVSILLELAERFASEKSPPVLPICFAAFDCEELGLIGSMAFTCEDDFRPENVEALINLDMFGRTFIGATEPALLVGSRKFPTGLLASLQEQSEKVGLRRVLFDSAIAGPCSDHVAFESLNIPSYFFTSGMFVDYHSPEDTADKLDYAAVTNSANIVYEVTKALAIRAVATPVSDDFRTAYSDIDSLRFFGEIVMNLVEESKEGDEVKAEISQLLEDAYGRYETRTSEEEPNFRKTWLHLLSTSEASLTNAGISRRGWIVRPDLPDMPSRRCSPAEAFVLWSRYENHLIAT